MGVMLKIRDENSTGDKLAERTFEFYVEYITVRELIEARVTQELEGYKKGDDDIYYGLVEPTEAERLLNGCKPKSGITINLEKQKKAAIQAFENNGFFLIVDDKQLDDLDERIMIHSATEVVFLKLVPLIGG